MPIDAHQWRAHTGMVGPSFVLRSSRRCSCRNQPKVCPQTLSRPLVLVVTLAFRAGVMCMMQMLYLLLLFAYEIPSLFSSTTSCMIQHLISIASGMLQLLSSFGYCTAQLLLATSSSPLKLLAVVIRLSYKILKCVSVLLVLCLVVIPMLLLISGDVERNPGPPKTCSKC